MGLTVLDTYTNPYGQQLSNVYVAFGTTPASIKCLFNENKERYYDIDISYGVWYNDYIFSRGLKPMTRVSMHLTGNVQETANVTNFLYTHVAEQFGNVINDGIDN